MRNHLIELVNQTVTGAFVKHYIRDLPPMVRKEVFNAAVDHLHELESIQGRELEEVINEIRGAYDIDGRTTN